MPIFWRGFYTGEVTMDGFRDRLGGRYDRSGTRGGYERMPSDDRYESDRYERSPRRGAGEGLSQEAVSEAVSEAINKANREQLDVIADFFDEAKADRMESERAIIDALSHSMSEAGPGPLRRADSMESSQPAEKITVVDEQNAETLSRIERIAGQNAEALNESGEMLERNVDALRSNAEILGEIRNNVGLLMSTTEESSSRVQESIRQSLGELSSRMAAPAQDLTVDFSEEKNEIIGAIGDNRAILNMIRQDVLNGFSRNNEEEEEEEEKVIPLSAEDASNYYKELEDHIHKECVKCYRNVQQALTDQNAEANAGVEKSVSGMRIMVLVSLLLNVALLALTVCNILGIFSF